MTSTSYYYIGLVGAVLFAVKTLPQLWVTIRRETTDDISMSFLIIEMISSLLLVVCALEDVNKNIPFLVSDGSSCFFTLILILVILKKRRFFKKRKLWIEQNKKEIEEANKSERKTT